MNEKKTYVAPLLTVLGDIENVTQASHYTHGDVPAGVGDAFS
jgi:hypothetical protein